MTERGVFIVSGGRVVEHRRRASDGLRTVCGAVLSGYRVSRPDLDPADPAVHRCKECR